MNISKSKSGVMLIEVIVSMVVVSIAFVMFYSVLPKIFNKSQDKNEGILMDYIQLAKDLRYTEAGSKIYKDSSTIEGDSNGSIEYFKDDKYIVRQQGGIVKVTPFVEMEVYYCRKVLSSTPCVNWSKKTSKTPIYSYHLWNLLLTDEKENNYNIVFFGK